MLNRTMDYILKNGEKAVGGSIATYGYIGGGPVALDSAGAIDGNFSERTKEVEFFGVAYKNSDYDNAVTQLATYITPPARISISQGAAGSCDQTTSGTNYADNVAPWDEAITDWAIGNLVRPDTKASSGGTSTYYACWTNKAYSYVPISTGVMQMYPGKITGLTGSGASVTELTIELTPQFTIHSTPY